MLVGSGSYDGLTLPCQDTTVFVRGLLSPVYIKYTAVRRNLPRPISVLVTADQSLKVLTCAQFPRIPQPSSELSPPWFLLPDVRFRILRSVLSASSSTVPGFSSAQTDSAAPSSATSASDRVAQRFRQPLIPMNSDTSHDDSARLAPHKRPGLRLWGAGRVVGGVVVGVCSGGKARRGCMHASIGTMEKKGEAFRRLRHN